VFDASRAILADPRAARAWTARAAALNRAGDHAAALKDATEALRLDPTDARALIERGYALHELGRDEEALADLRRAIALDPGQAMAHLYLAMVLEKLGRSAEAVESYRTAMRLDPSLKVLCEPAIARLTAAASAAPPAPEPRRWPTRLLAFAAGALVLWGIKRVFRPGWRTGAPSRGAAPEPAETLAPGRVIGGHLRVERELGRGGMGVVYLGTDLALDRPVAIKDLHRELHADAEVRARFLREARLAAKLRHPNLAQIHAVVDGGALRLVFEYVSGRPLDAVLRERGRLEPAEARRVLEGVGAALAYAHENKVVHRDLKPANVMIADDGAVKVMDFGIAHESRTVSAHTRTAAWGTPPYMAPEQEDGLVSRASDLYALGVTAYELLVGVPPFSGPGLSDKKRRRDFAPPSRYGLPAALDVFFARALDPDPARRPESVARFLADFAAATR